MPFKTARVDLAGVTILEVLASAVVILLGLGAVFGMNAQSLQVLRKAQQATAASQILQERIEAMRAYPWPEIARGTALASLFASPAASAHDLADSSPTETITVSPTSTPSLATARTESFQLHRSGGKVQVVRDADLTAERLLLVEVRITWREQQQTRERRLRTIIGRSGLTRSGVFGSAFGRAARGGDPVP